MQLPWGIPTLDPVSTLVPDSALSSNPIPTDAPTTGNANTRSNQASYSIQRPNGRNQLDQTNGHSIADQPIDKQTTDQHLKTHQPLQTVIPIHHTDDGLTKNLNEREPCTIEIKKPSDSLHNDTSQSTTTPSDISNHASFSKPTWRSLFNPSTNTPPPNIVTVKPDHVKGLVLFSLFYRFFILLYTFF